MEIITREVKESRTVSLFSPPVPDMSLESEGMKAFCDIVGNEISKMRMQSELKVRVSRGEPQGKGFIYLQSERWPAKCCISAYAKLWLHYTIVGLCQSGVLGNTTRLKAPPSTRPPRWIGWRDRIEIFRDRQHGTLCCGRRRWPPSRLRRQ